MNLSPEVKKEIREKCDCLDYPHKYCYSSANVERILTAQIEYDLSLFMNRILVTNCGCQSVKKLIEQQLEEEKVEACPIAYKHTEFRTFELNYCHHCGEKLK